METTGDGEGPTLYDFFQHQGVPVRYRKGELILHAEDDNAAIFYIESGFVKVYSLNGRGEEYILVVYGPNDFFPLLWLSRRVRRSVFFEALSTCMLVKARSEALEAAVHDSTPLAFEVIERALEQHGVFIDRINNLQYRYARERLVFCLLYLARRFGIVTGTEYEIAVRVSHQVLASNVNLSRESVGREMDRLIRKGMIEMRSGHIVLKDVKGLIAELPGASVSGDWWGLISSARDAVRSQTPRIS